MIRISVTSIFVVCVLAVTASAGAKDLPAGMAMVDIPGGTFIASTSEMGIPSKVTVIGFRLSETEVTWGQYCEFLNGKKPGAVLRKKWIKLSDEEGSSHIYKSGDIYMVDEGWSDHPVVNVSKVGARAFCNYYGLRLPKETEWAYGAGGPDHTKYPWGDEFDGTECCYEGNRGDSNPRTVPVKSFAPNGYGLYDMAGNVNEWCAGADKLPLGGSWKESSDDYVSAPPRPHGCPACPHPFGDPVIGFRAAGD